MPLAPFSIDDAAAHVLTALDERRSIPPLTAQAGGLGLDDASRISRAVTKLRQARGEQPVGRKIGFTNRTIWDEYGVHHPIDGPMYDTTVSHISGAVTGVSLGRFVEPRIEPEIVLALRAEPEPGMGETALIGCIGWIAHGFEIVQSLFPEWKFKGADCIAAFGLHGALLCGPRTAITAANSTAMLRALTDFSVTIRRNGEVMDKGHAANVLGGPLSALRHLAEAIAQDPEASPLAAGDIITTGTITRAFPVHPGERWTTSIDGLALPGLDVAFAG
ncbi:MAG: fumarylacetoacetate hydrolase family protein [Methylocystis sp.]|nr:fumarylacetoacetate hydrolase family protein [Methylocystis sp.]MCA3584426.1 fumarylacetoacetate hydrolase family protein [Methylocystis sp.]MCA3587211.1 fumarylacetoacetate hydrolase family protein [Methylocystis sp.]MCA3592553.1 fumarylacetoacetate hydrolase family protein [Methylocystis sp.]